MSRVKSFLRNQWISVLGIFAAVFFTLNAIAFYPGYMSFDSLSQLEQAKGIYPVGDWHPPIMMLIWRVLIAITHHTSSMLLAQLFVLWLAIFLLAWIVYTQTKRRAFSLLPFAIGVLPFTLSISGVIWKDVQMAYALLLAMVLFFAVLCVGRALKRWVRVTLMVIILTLISYAALLRYNALLAVIPLLFLVVQEFLPNIKKRYKVAAIAGCLIVILGTGSLINILTGAEKQNALSSVMVDDIINIRSQNEIENKDNDFRKDIVSIQFSCVSRGYIMNSYWICADDTQRKAIRSDYYPELREYWLKSVIKHPLRYISYKIETYATFLFASDRYVYHPGIDENSYEQKVLSKKVQRTMSVYAQQFGYDHFMFLFQPWFWLVAGIATLWFSLKKLSRFKLMVAALSLSSILYLLSYIPVVVATDYRYIYWSSIGLLLAWIIVLVEKYKPNLGNKEKVSRKRGKR